MWCGPINAHDIKAQFRFMAWQEPPLLGHDLVALDSLDGFHDGQQGLRAQSCYDA